MTRITTEEQKQQLKKGVRVYWHDPDCSSPEYDCSGPGTIEVCNSDPDSGLVDDETIISLCMDDEGYVECFWHELSLL